MATRRSRIQIKPNTGPRPTGKDTPKDATIDKQSLSAIKLTPQPAIKIVEKSPIKSNSSIEVKELSSVKSLGKAQIKFIDKSSIKVTDKQSVAEINKSPESGDKLEENKELTTKPLRKIISSSLESVDKESSVHDKVLDINHFKKESKESDICSKGSIVPSSSEDQAGAGTPKTIAAPTQRTRLRKLTPKVPEVRRVLKRTTDVQKKDDRANNVVENSVEIVVEPVTETHPSEEVSSNSSQENVDVPKHDPHVFKKPEEPTRRKSVTRLDADNPIQPEPRNTEVELYNKHTSKRSKHKEIDKQRSTNRKLRTEFNITEPPDKAKMTIMDLIYWNPMNNPMKKIVKDDVNKTDDQNSDKEGIVDEPDEAPDKAAVNKSVSEPTEEIVPGPRVIVGEDGQITLDESSLVIEQTAPEKDLSQEVLYETSDTTYTSYSKKIISRKLWSMRETAVFYKALSIVGTDFALMAKFFPSRNRADLKRKFKKEEKTRRDLLDKAVCEWHKFDLEDIQDFLFLNTEGVSVTDQDQEEAAVDNPESVAPRTVNQYVKENFLNKKPKGKEPKQGKEKPNGKENEKKPKEKKGGKRSLRNPWSDEEIDPVEEEEMETVCTSEEKDNDKGQECGAEELCLLKTKTSKRQQTLEAKRRKIEEQQALTLEAELKATRPVQRSPSPEPMSNSLSFTIIKSKTSMLPTKTGPIHPFTSPPTTPGGTCLSDSSLTPGSGSNSATTSLSTPKALTTTASNTFKIPNKASVIRFSSTSTTNSNLPSTSTDRPKDRTVVEPNSTESANTSTPTITSPVLQALLNSSSPITLPFPNTPGASPGQFLLVASKTPNNEQVVHVYLVSPNNAQAVTQTQQPQPSTSRTQATAEALLRLGITPIVQQKKNSDGSSERKS